MLLRQSLLAICVSLCAVSPAASAQCQNKCLAGSATPQDQFGSAVAQTPRYVVVGAHFEAGTGAAYVFENSGDGLRQSGRLVAAMPTGTDQFGAAVSVSRDTVVIGAPFSDEAPQTFTGSAHVFTKNATGWNEAQVLRASDAFQNDQFGVSLSIDGDWIAIGAALRNVGGAGDAGSVYLFERQAGSWVEVVTLTASDAQPGDFFGMSVGLSGSSLIVGAPFEDEAAQDAGAVYLFEYDGTSWNETDKLLSTLPNPLDEFGRAVALHGDTAVVGARNDDEGGRDAGSAFVLRNFGGTWFNFQKLSAVFPSAGDRFGTSVSITEGKILVGSPFHDTPNPDRGSAHLFTSNGGGWTETMTFEAFDIADFDRFGSAVAITHDRALVTSPQNDEAGSNAGALYSIPIDGPDCDGNGILDACEPTPYHEFCFGDGGDQMGCTNCPCGNHSTVGACRGCTNGTGVGARIVASGSPDVMGDTMRVDMLGANPMTFALLVSGAHALPRFGSNPCFDHSSGVPSVSFDGLRCTGGDSLRHGIRPTDANGDVGVTNSPWGEDPAFLSGVGFVAGQTRNYQAYYRELPTLVCGRALNTSQAFSVTFLP